MNDRIKRITTDFLTGHYRGNNKLDDLNEIIRYHKALFVMENNLISQFEFDFLVGLRNA